MSGTIEVQDMTRDKLLEDLRKMLYLKLMKLHIYLSTYGFQSLEDTGQIVTLESEPDWGVFGAVKDILQSLELLGRGDLQERLYESEEGNDDA